MLKLNFQAEVSSKTKKLTKLFHKLQNAEQEIKDLQVSSSPYSKIIQVVCLIKYCKIVLILVYLFEEAWLSTLAGSDLTCSYLVISLV